MRRLLSLAVPDLDTVLILIKEAFRGWDEPEFLKDMLHDGPGHHHADIAPFVQPQPDQVLVVSFVLLPRDDVVEAEPVLLPQFQPAGEEVFGKFQCVTLRGSGLNSF